jgi:hypothetical protein
VRCEQGISNQGQAHRAAKRTEPCGLRPTHHCVTCDRWYCSMHWFGRHADHGPAARQGE